MNPCNDFVCPERCILSLPRSLYYPERNVEDVTSLYVYINLK